MSALDSWAAQLGFLRADIAAGVERMARRLELAMGVEDPTAAALGEPDGYDGISARGPLDRLLTSEWLMAAEEPDEFVRRVAVDELTYLRLARADVRPPGRVAVLVDAGPDQVGAPRLVQLAGLVVLARLAARHEVPLAIGVAGDVPGSWQEGELPELFRAWLTARRSERADPDQVGEWLAPEPTGAGRPWYFGRGQAAAQAAACGARLLAAVDPVYGPEGVVRIGADVDGRRLDLELPPPATAVALLRGEGLRRTVRRRPDDGAPIGEVRWPQFTSNEPKVLCRTDDPRILATFTVSSATRPNVRRRTFAGPVLAAGVVGTRTVALVLEGDAVVVRIIGKHLAALADLTLHRSALELDDEALERQLSGPAEPVHFHGGGLYVCIDRTWWLLGAGEVPRPRPALVAVGATSTTDMVRLAHRAYGDDPGLVIDYGRRGDWKLGSGCLFGPQHTAAYPVFDGGWTVLQKGEQVAWLDPGGEPIGLCFDGSRPALVVRSEGGHLIRVVSGERTRTLTAASGDLAHASVHPVLPLVVVQRHHGPIQVVSTASGDVRATVQEAAR